MAGAGPKLLHFVRSTPLVAATLGGHKQTVLRPAGRPLPPTRLPCGGWPAAGGAQGPSVDMSQCHDQHDTDAAVRAGNKHIGSSVPANPAPHLHACLGVRRSCWAPCNALTHLT